MHLLSPKTNDSRPYTDRVKESLFSVLYKFDLIEGRRIADVFSGVGSMGLEALSRGATAVTFVEKDPKAIEMLKKNIEKSDFAEQSSVIRADAFKVGAPVSFEEEKYSIIFIDPPYPTTKDVGPASRLDNLIRVLPDQLAADGIAVVRTHRCVELMGEYDPLEIFDRRVWGNMAVTFLRHKRNDQ